MIQRIAEAEGGAEEAAPPDADVEQQREEERHDEVERHARDGVVGRVLQRRPEQVVLLEHRGIVVEADPDRRLDQVEGREAVVDRRQHRVGREPQEADDPRRHEGQADEQLPPLAQGHASTL
jgi:hypothetical protein